VVKQRLVVVTEHEGHVEWLQRAMGPAFDPLMADASTAERVVQLTDAASGSLVFVRVSAADLHERCALIAGILAQKPHLCVVAIGHEEDKDLILAAVRAGARDFLRVDAGRDETQAVVERLLRTAPTPTAGGGGHQTAVLCSRPDVATSCFAVHLALRLLEDVGPDEKVLLVDLGVPAADSLLYLDVEPSYTFVDAVRSVRRFDQTLIETAFSRDRSGLAVLPLLDDPNQVRDVNSSDMLALFSILKGYFAHTVVNLGGLRSPGFLAQALSQADRTLLLADQSVANCSAARRLLDDLEESRHPTRDIGLVLERYTEKLDPNAEKISEVLGLSVAATLPPAGFEMVRAMNSATTIYECAPESPYAKGIRALADEIAGIEPETPKGFAASRFGRKLRGLTGRA
jgi:pilus assembly protein CpaE